METKLIKVKYLNPLIRVREHHLNCNYDNYNKVLRSCNCMDKKYRFDYNFKLNEKQFEILDTKSKKYSYVCEVEGIYYYCYNLNEMLDEGFIPIEVEFDINLGFTWKIEGSNGYYKSQTYSEITLKP